MSTTKLEGIDLNAPLYTLSVEQFIALNQYINESKPQPKQEKKEYLYGLRGIGKFFGVCHKTAQRYKDTFLAPAIVQNGRKIMIEKNVAFDLYRNYKEGSL